MPAPPTGAAISSLNHSGSALRFAIWARTDSVSPANSFCASQASEMSSRRRLSFPQSRIASMSASEISANDASGSALFAAAKKAMAPSPTSEMG